MLNYRTWAIVGGQYGSEGKGKAAAYLAMRLRPSIVVAAFGPNAGHTCYYPVKGDHQGAKFVTHQLPIGLVEPNTIGAIGPGALINRVRLQKEMAELQLTPERLLIDPNAMVIEPEDVEEEQRSMVGISSTCQGTGEAIVRRVRRAIGTKTAKDYEELTPYIADVSAALRNVHDSGGRIQLEGSQGFGLDLLHAPTYPYCTGRSVTMSAVANDCGFPASLVEASIVVFRTYPIRVGDAYDANGKMLGTSGPVDYDSHEISWDEMTQLARSPEPLLERTTVTNKVRRIFTWSQQQTLRSLWFNQGRRITFAWINFLDYIDWSFHTCWRLRDNDYDTIKTLYYDWFRSSPLKPALLALGTGPAHEDVIVEPLDSRPYVRQGVSSE
jgi:adenylosuccinate synthase